MKKPSKKDIKAAIDKLKEKPSGSSGPIEPHIGKLSSEKSSKRIRKQGL
ncbi:MAG: hypothetical protein K8R88_12610 [Armatimonadetes bacterium]|nr:hypothetical protein [Armatimonadota bacterium]